MSSRNSARPLVLALSIAIAMSGPGAAFASESDLAGASASVQAKAETAEKKENSGSEETTKEAKSVRKTEEKSETKTSSKSETKTESKSETKSSSQDTKETTGKSSPSETSKESKAEETSAKDPTKSEEESTESSKETKAESVPESSEESSTEETSTAEETTKEETKDTTEESTKETTAAKERIYTYYDDGPITATIPKEYRFTKISGKPVILASGTKVYTKKSEDADVVAQADGRTAAYIIKDGDPWVYIESGYVRGFVQASTLSEGEEAKTYVQQYQAWLKEQLKAAGMDPDVTISSAAMADFFDTLTAKGDLPFGTMDISINHMDNPAFDYTLTTTMDVTIEKEYAVADEDITIYDNRFYAAHPDKKEASDHKIGTLKKGGLAYITADGEETAVFIESGDVRGFVKNDQLITGKKARAVVKKKGEYNMTTASGVTTPDKNRAFYYSTASVFKAGTGKRNAVTAFALQFVGNKYVWGGTSLTKGCDCSGFIQSIYRHYGYSLPRTSAAQRHAGKNVGTSLKNALPGDIICYDGHVAMYLGDGKMVHASNHHPYPVGGIKVSGNPNYRKILTIRRIIND